MFNYIKCFLQNRFEVGFNMRPYFLAFCSLEILAYTHLPVILQHRLRDILEYLQPVPHRLWLVVIPLDQRLTSLIIMTINFWWVEYKIVDAPAKILDSVLSTIISFIELTSPSPKSKIHSVKIYLK